MLEGWYLTEKIMQFTECSRGTFFKIIYMQSFIMQQIQLLWIYSHNCKFEWFSWQCTANQWIKFSKAGRDFSYRTNHYKAWFVPKDSSTQANRHLLDTRLTLQELISCAYEKGEGEEKLWVSKYLMRHKQQT